MVSRESKVLKRVTTQRTGIRDLSSSVLLLQRFQYHRECSQGSFGSARRWNVATSRHSGRAASSPFLLVIMIALLTGSADSIFGLYVGFGIIGAMVLTVILLLRQDELA